MNIFKSTLIAVVSLMSIKSIANDTHHTMDFEIDPESVKNFLETEAFLKHVTRNQVTPEVALEIQRAVESGIIAAGLYDGNSAKIYVKGLSLSQQLNHLKLLNSPRLKVNKAARIPVDGD